MRFAIFLLACSLCVACNRDVPNEPHRTPNPGNGGVVKVRAPGVKVDVQKNDSGKAKVDVNVK